MSAHFHDAGRRFSPADCADSADGFSTRERLARCGRALRLTENWNRRLPRTSPLSESQICEICEICGQTRDATSGLGDGVSRLADPSRELPNGPANVRRRDWQLPGGSADVRRVNWRSESGALGVFIHVPDLGMVIFSHKPRDFSVMRVFHGVHGRYGRVGRRPSGPSRSSCPSKTTT